MSFYVVERKLTSGRWHPLSVPHSSLVFVRKLANNIEREWPRFKVRVVRWQRATPMKGERL